MFPELWQSIVDTPTVTGVLVRKIHAFEGPRPRSHGLEMRIESGLGAELTDVTE